MVYAGVMSSKLKEMWFIEIDEAGIGAKRISPGSVTNTAVTRRIVVYLRSYLALTVIDLLAVTNARYTLQL